MFTISPFMEVCFEAENRMNIKGGGLNRSGLGGVRETAVIMSSVVTILPRRYHERE